MIGRQPGQLLVWSAWGREPVWSYPEKGLPIGAFVNRQSQETDALGVVFGIIAEHVVFGLAIWDCWKRQIRGPSKAHQYL